MSSKIITTVVAVAVVGPFAYFAQHNAVSIKQNLQKQTSHIQKLNTESVKLDKDIKKTEEVKKQTVEEVQAIEQETQQRANENKKLEAELGAN